MFITEFKEKTKFTHWSKPRIKALALAPTAKTQIGRNVSRKKIDKPNYTFTFFAWRFGGLTPNLRLTPTVVLKCGSDVGVRMEDWRGGGFATMNERKCEYFLHCLCEWDVCFVGVSHGRCEMTIQLNLPITYLVIKDTSI